jgi:hypothetical protein
MSPEEINLTSAERSLASVSYERQAPDVAANPLDAVPVLEGWIAKTLEDALKSIKGILIIG